MKRKNKKGQTAAKTAIIKKQMSKKKTPSTMTS